MPNSVARRGNPWRDVYGHFCSRRVAELTLVARAAGLSSGYYISLFVENVDIQGLSVGAAAQMTPEDVWDLVVLPSYLRRRAGTARVGVAALNAAASLAQMGESVSRVGSAARSLRSAGANRGFLLLGAGSTAAYILDNLQEFEDVLEYANLRWVRRDDLRALVGDNECYWLETPDGNQFWMRRSLMTDLFSMLQSATRTDRDISLWLDDYCSEVDMLRWTLESLLENAQSLGIPGYENGSSLPESTLAGYARTDVDSLGAYVREWGDASTEAFRRFQDGAITSCSCPECQFVRFEISYGDMLRRRANIDGASPDEPGWPVGDELTVAPFTSSLSDLLANGAPPLGWNPTPRQARAATPRQEGYYDDHGNWVVGRRPAAHTRTDETYNTHPARFGYDGFLSPENFSDDEERGDEDRPRQRYDAAAAYGIQAWDYKAPLDFYGEGNLFFGFENEINAPYDSASIPQSVDYIGTTKWDGSVDGGYEIVSQPMSWDYIRNADFSWIPELRDAGAKAGRNGLHVHISRDGFASDWHRYKAIKLWMDRNNYDEVKAFARRHNTEYASPYTRLTNYRMARRISVQEGSRYCALNVQNETTIEIRNPASTLNRIKLIGTIGGLAALVEYTRRMDSQQVALGGLQWSALVQWAVEREDYAPFIKYLEILREEGAPECVFPDRFHELVNA